MSFQVVERFSYVFYILSTIFSLSALYKLSTYKLFGWWNIKKEWNLKGKKKTSKLSCWLNNIFHSFRFSMCFLRRHVHFNDVQFFFLNSKKTCILLSPYMFEPWSTQCFSFLHAIESKISRNSDKIMKSWRNVSTFRETASQDLDQVHGHSKCE